MPLITVSSPLRAQRRRQQQQSQSQQQQQQQSSTTTMPTTTMTTTTTTSNNTNSTHTNKYEMDPVIYNELCQLPGNDTCIDCKRPKPDWGSPKLGIFFCFHCSGKHRGLGTHISFVRSVKMDTWTDREIQLMRLGGGNTKCNDFLTKHGITNIHTEMVLITSSSSASASASTSQSSSSSSFYQQKYDTPAAELYRQVLRARVDGKPEPTSLPQQQPQPKPQSATSSSASNSKTSSAQPSALPSIKMKKKMEGFGSDGRSIAEIEAERKQRQTKRIVVTTAAVTAAASTVAAAVLWFFMPF